MRRLRSPPFNADALDASRARGEEVREERRSGKGLLPLSHNVSRLTVTLTSIPGFLSSSVTLSGLSLLPAPPPRCGRLQARRRTERMPHATVARGQKPS